MKRTYTIFAIIAVFLLLIVGGKYVGYALLTALVPVYSLLLASILLIVFLAVAASAIAINRNWFHRTRPKAVNQSEVEVPRKAA